MRAVCAVLRLCDSIRPEGTGEHDDEWWGKQGCMIRFERGMKRMLEDINVDGNEKNHRDQRGRHEPEQDDRTGC